MIYPTRLAVLAAAAGVPFALVVAAAMPERWYVGPGLAGGGAAAVADRRLHRRPPRRGQAGGARQRLCRRDGGGASSTVTLRGRGLARRAEVAVAANALIAAEDDGRLLDRAGGGPGRGAAAAGRWPGAAVGRLEQLWLRWRGPLGLAWQQRRIALGSTILILPDVRPVQERGAQVFQRHALQGLIAQINRGDGTDFDALVEYRSGMDRRAIDWKQSARHRKLHAKEFRSERNNQIVFAIDGGRQMSEPVAGLPRVDRAVSAMLLTGWVALKLGDRVALHAFEFEAADRQRPDLGLGRLSRASAPRRRASIIAARRPITPSP